METSETAAAALQVLAPGKYHGVIFDLDGTLLNTLADLTASVNASLESFGFPTCTEEQVLGYVGNGVKRLMAQAVPEGTAEEVAARAFDIFREHYDSNCMVLTQPYPGVLDLLKALKAAGYKLGIVSNKLDPLVQKMALHYFSDGGAPLVDAAIGEREDLERKPSPDMPQDVLHRLQCPPEKVLYVGDSLVDMRTAANTGLDCALVTWGFVPRERLEAAVQKAQAEGQPCPALVDDIQGAVALLA